MIIGPVVGSTPLGSELNQNGEAPEGSILTEDGLFYLITEDEQFYIEQETEA